MALAALLSSIALMAAAPAPLLLAQADAPAVSNPVTDPNLEASADALASGEDPFPAGAPTDDFGFMAWCYGALAGHVDLYDKVLPEVTRIEGQFPEPGVPIEKVMAEYKTQHDVGMATLKSYARALSVQEAGDADLGAKRAEAVSKGRDIWRGSASADNRQLAQLWMSWGLPGRCESTASRLAPAPSN